MGIAGGSVVVSGISWVVASRRIVLTISLARTSRPVVVVVLRTPTRVSDFSGPGAGSSSSSGVEAGSASITLDGLLPRLARFVSVCVEELVGNLLPALLDASVKGFSCALQSVLHCAGLTRRTLPGQVSGSCCGRWAGGGGDDVQHQTLC